MSSTEHYGGSSSALRRKGGERQRGGSVIEISSSVISNPSPLKARLAPAGLNLTSAHLALSSLELMDFFFPIQIFPEMGLVKRGRVKGQLLDKFCCRIGDLGSGDRWSGYKEPSTCLQLNKCFWNPRCWFSFNCKWFVIRIKDILSRLTEQIN